MESNLVPSANLICTEVTGWLVSMLTDGVGVEPVGVAWDAEAVDWTTSGVILEKKIEREEEKEERYVLLSQFLTSSREWHKFWFLLNKVLISSILDINIHFTSSSLSS